MFAIFAVRLWREDDVGTEGWIGAELLDGTLVALCPVEKWNLGRDDSLRKNWRNGEKRWLTPKRIQTDVSERDLRADGLGTGRLAMSGHPSRTVTR